LPRIDREESSKLDTSEVSQATWQCPKKRIKQQHRVHIASQNTGGLKSDHKLQELITTVKRKQLFAVCL